MMTIKQTIYRDFREHGINESIIKNVLDTLEKWLTTIKGSDIKIDSSIEKLHNRVLNLIYKQADEYMIEALMFENIYHPFVPLFKNRKYE